MASKTPQYIVSKIIGTPGNTPFTTFSVVTGPVLGFFTKFAILRARISVVGAIGSSWYDLDPADPFVWQYWRDYGGIFNVARISHYFFDIPGSIAQPIHEGLLLDTGVTYDVSSLVGLGQGVQVDAIFLELMMYN